MRSFEIVWERLRVILFRNFFQSNHSIPQIAALYKPVAQLKTRSE